MSHRGKWAWVVLLSAAAGALLSLAALRLLPGGSGGAAWTADPPALLREIRQLDELVTVKYTVQKVVGLEEAKIPVGRERLLLIVQADVLAGVDLSRLTTSQITVGAGAVVVRLPPARILHVVFNEDETRVWDRQITWWSPWVPYNADLERQARLKAREEVIEAAKRMRILEQAQRRAETSIRSLIILLGARSVSFSSES